MVGGFVIIVPLVLVNKNQEKKENNIRKKLKNKNNQEQKKLNKKRTKSGKNEIRKQKGHFY